MRIPAIEKILSKIANNTNVQFFFSKRVAGDDFDQYEKNYTDVFENPITRKLYVTEFTPEGLAWRVEGLNPSQGKMVVCDSKYENWFRYATKIVIDNVDYTPFAKGGANVRITHRPNNLIRVIMYRV